MNTKQQIAIVTGAGRGLGRAMAVGLLDHGVAVVAVDRDKEPLDELAQSRSDAPVVTLAQDLTAPGAEERVRDAALSAFGASTILSTMREWDSRLYCPIMAGSAAHLDIELDQWQRFSSSIRTFTFRMSKMAVRWMMEQRWGRIINVTTASVHASPGFAPYGASKAAAESSHA